MNEITLKILLHLYDSIDSSLYPIQRKNALGLEYFLNKWNEFNHEQITNALKELNRYNLIEKQKYNDSILISLSEKGILRAQSIKLRHLKDIKGKWDGKWRMVAFDIPDNCTKGRKALVYRLKSAEFYEMQKSLFLCPYDCKKEVTAIVKLFRLEKYVKFGLLESFDNQENVSRIFKL